MADGCRYVYRRFAVWILRSCEAQHGAPFAPIESVEPLLYPVSKQRAVRSLG